MKVLKGLAYFFVSVFVIYIILCFIGPKKFEASKSISIAVLPSVAFDYVSNFRTWPEWDPWSNQDPTMQINYETPIGIGHRYSWSSERMGNGSQEIIDQRINEYIKTALVFTDWDGVSHSEFFFEAVDIGTKITWTMDGSDLPFLARGVLLVMGAQKAIQSDYEKGLAALKEKLESGAGISIQIETIEMEELMLIGKRQKVDPEMMNEAWYDAVMDEIAAIIKASGRQITGAPLAIIHDYSDSQMDVEVAFPVDGLAEATEGFTMTTIPAGRALRHVYEGPYEEMGEAWGQMERHVQLRAFELSFSPYEQYVVNPGDFSDSTQHVTHIVYPIK
jgi:effector-binding domain-containing protein